MKLTLRIWILIIVLVLSFFTVFSIPSFFESGVKIKSVEKNSTAFNEGLRENMIIKSINNEEISSLDDYSRIISETFSDNSEKKLTIQTNTQEFIFLADKLDISVENIPKTKIRTGLDLSGGARALVKPEKSLSSTEMSDLISVTSERLNVFGISDVTIRQVSDLEGNSFMLVEIAGATTSDLKELVGKQGKFEAKIGNDTVFIGGKKDISSVCRNDASCARIESCGEVDGGFACRFSFAVYLSEEAAKRHAKITENLGESTESTGYLDKKLDLYLDDKLVDSLFISKDLKGRVTTQVAISGSGTGKTQQEALAATQESMKKLQTILITGSLPYKLEIVKLDSISPALGKEFTKNIMYLALIVFIIVSVVLFVKYRKIKITLAVILTMFSEALITLAVASLIRWNLDAPSIAGIIAGMGTGVNDQIVIIDEAVSNINESIKDRIKRALFVILGAFFTIIAAMLPLFWAGAGMLRGFALTTIIGVTGGILITRPAFADILKRIQK